MAEFTPITTQDQLDSIIGDRIKRERNTVSKEFQTQLDEANAKITGYEKQISDLNKSIEESGKTNASHEKTIAEMQNKIKGYESASVKTRIAHEVGLPYEMAARLSGETEEDIRKDAEGLFKLMGHRRTAPPLASTEHGVTKDEKKAAMKSVLAGLKGE